MARQTSSQDMLKFNQESLCHEWMNEAPIFYLMLQSSALSERQKDFNTVTWSPHIAMAGSVLLRERSRGMDAMQLLVTTIIRSSANQVLTIIGYFVILLVNRPVHTDITT